jgi:flavin-dependent dehydrogenase
LLNSAEVFVIGGGPAGLAAAIAARQQGLSVMLADGARPPIDKACGEALMPDAIAALHQLGVAFPGQDACRLRGVRFLSSATSKQALTADADFPSGLCGTAIRRTALHRAMVERAAESGVDLLWQTAVTGIFQSPSHAEVQLGERKIRARWIIGADGAYSRVRRWANLEAHSRSALRYSFRRHYRVRPWSNRMEIYWGKRSQAYATAISDNEVCVAVASHDPKLRLDEALNEFPELCGRLGPAEVSSLEKGSISANRKLKRVWQKNLALIGDASGTVDAITGEGLGLAFNQALVLASSLRTSNLTAYQIAHRRLALRPTFMARLMLTLDGRPRLQQRVLKTFRQRPEIFRSLVAFHVGRLSPLNLALDGLTLGWELLTA